MKVFQTREKWLWILKPSVLAMVICSSGGCNVFFPPRTDPYYEEQKSTPSIYQPPNDSDSSQPVTPSVARYLSDDFSDHPHQNTTAAVLMFDARGGLSADVVALLTDRFSVELGRTDVYRLVSQSKMKEILDFQSFDAACGSTECAVEAGQLLGVEYILYGSIGRIGTLYTINVYVTSVEKGDIVASETVDHRGDIESLLTEGMSQAMSKLLMKTMGGRD